MKPIFTNTCFVFSSLFFVAEATTPPSKLAIYLLVNDAITLPDPISPLFVAGGNVASILIPNLEALIPYKKNRSLCE